MAKVLIIDDDLAYCDVLSQTVDRMGHEVSTANTLENGFRTVEAGDFDVVFLDVRMPDGSGLEFLPRIKGVASSPEVIIVTGLGDPDGAEMAIRFGAWDYIQKGSSLKEITLPLSRALQYRREKANVGAPVVIQRAGIVGSGPRVRENLALMAKAANSNANVLITGETGTGKELFARAIHENSRRAGNNFVVVDCAALPETLVESVLFGHAKGAFTGADRAQDGLIRQADGGTLFLDEVGELPLIMQGSFLRALQEQRFRPVGGKDEVSSDFRLVAATNRNLDARAAEGFFRMDLLYRLRSFVIELSPLRESKEDVKELAVHYITKLCERNSTGAKGFSPDFMEALAAYNWPGNVRELVHTIDRALAAAQDEPTLYPKHLPPHIRIHLARSSVMEDNAAVLAGPEPARSPESGPTQKTDILPTLQNYRETLEKKYFEELMDATRGDVKEACRISGLSRSRLYDMLKKYEIHRPG
jgi:two-component system NtrC family response regulator